ncbi:hypothetical protein KY290_015948 [Solanum tuberosum]|uniref:Uncharacterized protein n=1 Tax=Solanum tuberosum TaxID=4113 RepID=A0ABQ7VTX6_SOLTU|nr:hypothetical protein KY289_014310 [Solanum tuberosum]KAH0699430.1 hypothetical protein KY284_013645 [Solanum tuberosum]KAH0771967.1 hypothetical protein KY290_015948 [Solanum tuberosum]
MKASIQLRNRDEETREQAGHLLFSFNWKTQGVRKARVDIKEKVVEKCLHRSTKRKCKAQALFQARHELHQKVHLKEGRIQKRNGDSASRTTTFLPQNSNANNDKKDQGELSSLKKKLEGTDGKTK